MATVKIDITRLKELEKYEMKFLALEHAGVDNWDGYNFALDEINLNEKRDELIQEIITTITEEVTSHIDEPAGRGCGYGIREEFYVEAEAIIKDFIDKYINLETEEEEEEEEEEE